MSSQSYYFNLITKWSAEEDGHQYLLLQKKIAFLSEYLYYDYEPTYGTKPLFDQRLVLWLQNLQSEDYQKALLKLVPTIFYLGREELNCLYKTAFNTQIKNWLIKNGNKNFESDDYLGYLEGEMKNTWFCPVTDSFRINQFYHINQITSKHTFRPDWRSLKKFADKEKIIQYILAQGVKHIVLLEDFVGSGTQAKSPVTFACELIKDERLADVNLLFVPLMICPKGVEKIDTLHADSEKFSYESLIKIKNSDLINEEILEYFPENEDVVQMINETFDTVKGALDNEEVKKLEPFGYKNTGGLVVMYTNTPNNSLPLIFLESDTWSPLFKRHSRD